MKLAELKAYCQGADSLQLTLPDGTLVPAHYHVTELGEVTKRFIDCGGTLRDERVASLQLWVADDHDHRLSPNGLTKIIEMAEDQLGLGNLPLEVEYQGAETIQKFGLAIEKDSPRPHQKGNQLPGSGCLRYRTPQSHQKVDLPGRKFL